MEIASISFPDWIMIYPDEIVMSTHIRQTRKKNRNVGHSLKCMCKDVGYLTNRGESKLYRIEYYLCNKTVFCGIILTLMGPILWNRVEVGYSWVV